MPEDQIWAYADDLKRYANYLCRHQQDAEDVTQNAMLKAAQSLGGAYRAEASVRTWLHAIVTNECRMLRRRLGGDSLDCLLEQAPEGFDQRSNTKLPEQAALEAESHRSILAHMKSMPLSYQQVLVLRDGCGMPASEVAEMLDLSVGAIKSRLYRARKSLREKVDENPLITR